MTLSKLKWRINGKYNYILQRLPYLVDGKINGVHNSKRKRITGEINESTYEGYLLCGAATHIIYNSEWLPMKRYIHSKGKGKTYEDHTFLKLYDNIIIDPTWRQMFRSYYGKGDEDFFKILYEKRIQFH